MEAKDFFARKLQYFDVQYFENFCGARKITPASLSDEDIRRAVKRKKFEQGDGRAIHRASLPLHGHGVNAFFRAGGEGTKVSDYRGSSDPCDREAWATKRNLPLNTLASAFALPYQVYTSQLF